MVAMPGVVRRASAAVAGAALVLLGAALVAPGPARAAGGVIRVPQDHPTVQAAVDAAQPGDLILVDVGVYHEAVVVGEGKDGITIRGVDRNGVVFDGQDQLGTAITVDRADGVTLENMTAHNYTANGFFWTSVDGYVGRYLTAYNIGLYPIYAFDSVNGLFEHSYASGAGDGAFYIGQCNPCNAIIRHSVATLSALGYSGTNSGGNLILEDNVFERNGGGLLPNSLDSEANPPQRGATFRRNIIRDNGNPDTPASGLAGAALGIGLGIAGGQDNIVEDNEITGNSKWGVVITPLPDQNVWIPSGNIVRNNVVTGNGAASPNGADLALAAGSGEGNCFEGNTFGTSRPPAIEDAYPCGGGLGALPVSGDPGVAAELADQFARTETGLDERPSYTEMPAPPPQPNMPGATDLPGPSPEEDAAGAAPAPALPATGGGAVAILAGIGLLVAALRRR